MRGGWYLIADRGVDRQTGLMVPDKNTKTKSSMVMLRNGTQQEQWSALEVERGAIDRTDQAQLLCEVASTTTQAAC